MNTSEAQQELASVKRAARAQAGKVRSQLHEDSAGAAKDILAETGLSFAGHKVGTVSGFLPFRSEIDVTGLLARLGAEGWTTALPVVLELGQPLEFRRWKPGNPTEPGRWNIPIPLASAGTVEPDVLIVPMLAFDREGYRLGYGGGFYDRTLQMLRQKKQVVAIGAAYAGQEIADVPHDELDQRLDWVLTEKGPIACGENS